jgi:hypothetical protein
MSEDLFSTGNNKYGISQLMYPNDLLDPIYGGNMAVFFINISSESKFLSKVMGNYDMSTLDVPRIRGLTIGRKVSALNAAASGVAAAILPALVVGSAGGFGSVVSAGGAIGTAALWAGGEIAGTTTREQKRLNSAIALHMPNGLSIRYTANWETEDMATAEMASQLGESGMAAMKSLSEVNTSTMIDSMQKSTNDPSGSIKKIVNSAVGAGAVNQAMANVPGGAYMSARTGLAPNPRKEMVFKGVDFRTFSFEYKFFPRSDDEAKNVERIINTFKFHMHPEFKDKDSYLYVYPSEFDISYYTSVNGIQGINTHVHKHTSCVLIEMSVSYGSQGNFTVFANGMPTEINITLTFKELMVPTKETIKDPTGSDRGL